MDRRTFLGFMVSEVASWLQLQDERARHQRTYSTRARGLIYCLAGNGLGIVEARPGVVGGMPPDIWVRLGGATGPVMTAQNTSRKVWVEGDVVYCRWMGNKEGPNKLQVVHKEREQKALYAQAYTGNNQAGLTFYVIRSPLLVENIGSPPGVGPSPSFCVAEGSVYASFFPGAYYYSRTTSAWNPVTGLPSGTYRMVTHGGVAYAIGQPGATGTNVFVYRVDPFGVAALVATLTVGATDTISGSGNAIFSVNGAIFIPGARSARQTAFRTDAVSSWESLVFPGNPAFWGTVRAIGYVEATSTYHYMTDQGGFVSVGTWNSIGTAWSWNSGNPTPVHGGMDAVTGSAVLVMSLQFNFVAYVPSPFHIGVAPPSPQTETQKETLIWHRNPTTTTESAEMDCYIHDSSSNEGIRQAVFHGGKWFIAAGQLGTLVSGSTPLGLFVYDPVTDATARYLDTSVLGALGGVLSLYSEEPL